MNMKDFVSNKIKEKLIRQQYISIDFINSDQWGLVIN